MATPNAPPRWRSGRGGSTPCCSLCRCAGWVRRWGRAGPCNALARRRLAVSTAHPMPCLDRPAAALPRPWPATTGGRHAAPPAAPQCRGVPGRERDRWGPGDDNRAALRCRHLHPPADSPHAPTGGAAHPHLPRSVHPPPCRRPRHSAHGVLASACLCLPPRLPFAHHARSAHVARPPSVPHRCCQPPLPLPPSRSAGRDLDHAMALRSRATGQRLFDWCAWLAASVLQTAAQRWQRRWRLAALPQGPASPSHSLNQLCRVCFLVQVQPRAEGGP